MTSNESPQVQPQGNPERQLQPALKAFRDQVQNAPLDAEGRHNIDCRALREAAVKTLQATPSALGQIRTTLNALYPGAGGFLPEENQAALKFLNSPFPLPAPNRPDTLRLTPAARQTLLKSLEGMLPSSAPLSNPEVQDKVKQALAKVNTELEALRQQVQKTQKGNEQLRKNAADAIVGLRSASPERYAKLVTSLSLTIDQSTTPEQIAKSLESLDKRADAMTKALQDLAREVGGNYPAPRPDANMQRRTGMVVSTVNRIVDSLYSADSQIGKYLRDWLGTADEAKAMILDSISNFFASFSSASFGVPGPFRDNVDRSVRGIGEELEFQRALASFNGNRLEVNDAWRGRYIISLRNWRANTRLRETNPAAPDPGPRPTLESTRNAQVEDNSAKLKAEQAANKTTEENNAKAKKDAEADLKTPRSIEGRTIPGAGLEITSTPPMDVINIGNKTVHLRKTAGGDYQMKVEVNSTTHNNWINMRTQTGRPNSMRLWAPQNATSLADLRIVTVQSDGTPDYAKRTAPLSLRLITEALEKRGVQQQLTLQLRDDNSAVELLTAEQLKKQAESANTVEALLKKTAGQLLAHIESLPKLLTQAQQKLEAGQALLKMSPDLLRIARASINGQQPGLMDGLTLLQAYQHLQTIGGPAVEPVRKSIMSLLANHEVVTLLQAGSKAIQGGPLEGIMKLFGQGNQKMNKEQVQKIVEQISKMNIPPILPF